MKVNWKSLRSKINTKAEIAKKAVYEVLWIAKSEDNKNLGETRWDPKQIVLETGSCDKETVCTYLHEVLHTVDHEYEVGLTETQIRKLEAALPFILKPGNIFKE